MTTHQVIVGLVVMLFAGAIHGFFLTLWIKWVLRMLPGRSGMRQR